MDTLSCINSVLTRVSSRQFDSVRRHNSFGFASVSIGLFVLSKILPAS